jgi:mRNA interferase MazF
VTARQGQAWWVNLDHTVGSEIKKTRPAVIVSPNELNDHLRTVVVVPLTSGKAYPFRIKTRVGGKDGVAAVDQIRTIDKQRLVKKIGTVKPATLKAVLDTLAEMFAY